MNSIAAFTLLLSYLLPYVSPKTFPLLSVLSLAVPVLIVINVLFFMYWAILFKRKLLLSLIVLLLGVSHVRSLYKIKGKEVKEEAGNSLSLLSYNVHSFNRFRWIDSDSIPVNISQLVKEVKPDIFCAQEYYDNPDIDFSQYAHKYQIYNNDNGELALVIYTRYPIVHKGSLNLKNTANNIIFADIAIPNDTVRVYNVHLQSHKLNSQIEDLDLNEENSDKLLRSIQVSFKKQQTQAEKLMTHMSASPYKNIIMGDFNNTAYSYVYEKIKSKGLKDAYKEAGEGFGKTFKFDLFPARIDFILVPEEYEVLSFKSDTREFSDHFPIFSSVKL
ncbi:endonuclease/exonuclease/phosphatase family protein [Aquimarina sp. TRL1]|uniref:endonuclease/exonuclease/phosphatase family protein n=1 Tax=Aquimarina sp. (strain TRL1) TaxID=2736252 RepID=UPI00158C6CEF|nr:endonuclease/exonuclease/phosphatase family protein [Aquimarina sp. TRL1]QKX05988.1 endonuclease/exonuclease/phosphatase family protein [Aquimarina sp. TRL1]